MRDAIKALTVENEKQDQLILQYDKDIERLSEQKKGLDQLKAARNADFEQKRNEINEMERNCDEIYKRYQLALDQLAVQKAEQVRLNMKTQNLNLKVP
jgi:hypothetical protein